MKIEIAELIKKTEDQRNNTTEERDMLETENKKQNICVCRHRGKEKRHT